MSKGDHQFEQFDGSGLTKVECSFTITLDIEDRVV